LLRNKKRRGGVTGWRRGGRTDRRNKMKFANVWYQDSSQFAQDEEDLGWGYRYGVTVKLKGGGEKPHPS